ncbi:multivesicular body subunit 12A isoform X2 [Rhinoraja longicauda]
MAAPEMNDSNCYPLTGVGWTSSPNTCPKEYQLITTTTDGSSANFAKGFGQKSGSYLCVSSLLIKENPHGDVVADILLLPDKCPLRSGYSFVDEFIDSKVIVSKKKRLCIRRIPFKEADTAIFDVKLTGKSKQIVPSYTCIGKSQEDDAHIIRLTKRRSNMDAKDAVYGSENIYGISAMDGVPFALHPRFENTMNVPNVNVTNVQIKSRAEIENEYNYSFMTEKTAAARLPPTAS